MVSSPVRRSSSGHRMGEDHPRANADDDEVEIARELREEHGLSYGEIAEKLEQPRSTVRDWCNYNTR